MTDEFEDAVAEIQKKHGKAAIVDLNSGPLADVNVIPSGNLALDLALGVGGYARGRVVEIYGPESAGKSTLTLHAVASAQAMGLNCLIVDAEHALDPPYAEALGVDLYGTKNGGKLVVSQPDTAEQGLDICLEACKSGGFGLVVIDSVAALSPRAEIEGDIGDSHVGLQARLMSQSLRMITPAAARSDTCVYFVNQLREKIGVMFGSPETTPGGRALKFYASQRLDIRRIEQIKQGTDVVGNRTRVKVIKNKVAPPFKVCEFDIMYGEGASQAGTILDLGVEAKVLTKSGGWYAVAATGEKLGNGREACKTRLNEDPDLMVELYAEISEAFR